MVPFAQVLEYLERHDWVLYRIHKPYRVFYKHGTPATGLPILVEVNAGGTVDEEHFEKIRRIVERDAAGSNGET